VRSRNRSGEDFSKTGFKGSACIFEDELTKGESVREGG